MARKDNVTGDLFGDAEPDPRNVPHLCTCDDNLVRVSCPVHGEEARRAGRRAGEAGKEEGMERVDQADPDWGAQADRAVAAVARSQATVTADDVRLRLEAWGIRWTHHGKKMGPVMKRAAAAKLIERTDRTVRSSIPSSHARDLRVWRSRVYQPTEGVRP